MKKKNYSNQDDFDYDNNGPEFENLEKNILQKIEASLVFIFSLSALFLLISLVGYGGGVGENVFQILTTSFGLFAYLAPILFGALAYLFYSKNYKILISKFVLLGIVFLASIFMTLDFIKLSGNLGTSLGSQIEQYIGEIATLLFTFLIATLSLIGMFNSEQTAIAFSKSFTTKTFYILSNGIKNFFRILGNLLSKTKNTKTAQSAETGGNIISTKLPLNYADTKEVEIKKSLFSFSLPKFTNPLKFFSSDKSKTIKVKHGKDIEEIEMEEDEFESEEFKKKYEVEKDEEGNEYITPKKNRNVHEELLEAASVKLSKEEKEKIRVKKISKKDESENIKINEYPEEAPKQKKKVLEEVEDEVVVELEEKYVSPPLNLYEEDKGKPSAGDNKANAQTIKRTLQNFQISVEMDEVSVGPTVTRYTLKPAQGVKLSKIAGLDKNLAMDLSTTSIRIEAPIPGKSLVGIEIPNRVKATLGIGTLFSNPLIQEDGHPLTIALGKDINGRPVFVPLSKMPHLLIAGTTGSGKSSTIHALIQSLIFKNSANHLKFIMIDPKKVELSLYQKLPHLYTPVVKEPKKAVQVLNWLINEMERRYEVLESFGKVNIAGYHTMMHEKNAKIIEKNKKRDPGEKENLLERMPYFVIVVDELADFMMAYPKEMESCIVRLAQKSRAVGIHLVLSTQRPSTNVITGVIKGNIPARIALKVVSQIDSRVILDTNGAEKLLGAGDMLFMNSDGSDIKRIQAPFVSEREIERVVDFLRNKYKDFAPQEIALPQSINIQAIQGRSVESGDGDSDEDDRFQEAKDIVIQTKIASVTFLQRKMGIGYGRAARLIDLLEQKGIVGPQQTGSKPREVYGDSGSPLKNSDTLPDDYNVEKDGYLV